MQTGYSERKQIKLLGITLHINFPTTKRTNRLTESQQP
jgi:hypothetical protein